MKAGTHTAGSLGQEGVRRGTPPRTLLHLLDDSVPEEYAGSLIRTRSYWASRKFEAVFRWWGGDPPPELRFRGLRSVTLTEWLRLLNESTHGPTLVHCHGVRSGWVQWWASLLRRWSSTRRTVRAVLTIPPGFHDGGWHRWKMALSLPVYRFFHRIIVEDPETYTRLSGWHAELEHKLTLLVVEESWPQDSVVERERRTLRSLLGVKEPERLVGWVVSSSSRLHARLPMLRAIQREQPFRLILFGEATTFPSEIMGGNASLWLLTQRDLRWMDVVVWERPTWASVGTLLQLLMHGVVLILLDPHPDITREFQNGHELFELRSGEDRFLNLYLRWFLRDGQFLRHFSQDARQRIRERYARWKRVRFLERLYHTALMVETPPVH